MDDCIWHEGDLCFFQQLGRERIPNQSDLIEFRKATSRSKANWTSCAMISNRRPRHCRWTNYVSARLHAAWRPWQTVMPTWQPVVAPQTAATCHLLPMRAGELKEHRLPGMKSQHMKAHATRWWDNKRRCGSTNRRLGHVCAILKTFQLIFSNIALRFIVAKCGVLSWVIFLVLFCARAALQAQHWIKIASLEFLFLQHSTWHSAIPNSMLLHVIVIDGSWLSFVQMKSMLTLNLRDGDGKRDKHITLG